MRRSAVPTKLLPRASRRPKKVKGPALVTSDEFVGDDWLAVDEPRTKRKRPNSDVTYFTTGHRKRKALDEKREEGEGDVQVRDVTSTQHRTRIASGSEGDDTHDVTLTEETPADRNEHTRHDDVTTANTSSSVHDPFLQSTDPGDVINVSQLAVRRNESTPVAHARAVMRIRVRVCDDIVIVPVRDVSTCFAQLAEEAAKRYCERRSLKPVLSLRSAHDVNSATYSNEDRVADFLQDNDIV